MNKDLLEQKMKERNISKKDMYTALGISRSAFFRKCNGETEFTLSEIKKICEILHEPSPMRIFFNAKVS